MNLETIVKATYIAFDDWIEQNRHKNLQANGERLVFPIIVEYQTEDGAVPVLVRSLDDLQCGIGFRVIANNVGVALPPKMSCNSLPCYDVKNTEEQHGPVKS